MEQSTKLGGNKTGIDMSPMHSKEMINASNNMPLKVADSNETAIFSAFAELEQSYLRDADALGSVPLPGTLKGMVKSTVQMATGKHPEVFINKLGERLAYERSGIRVYEHLIMKCVYVAQDMTAIELPMETLTQFRDEEAEHFQILTRAIKKLGADPTAQTPDADASSVATSGLMKVITDPRTSITQTLQAMLALELADNAAWELLIKLAVDLGQPEMAQQFQHALDQENVHLAQVREWYERSVRLQATKAPSLN